jgi:hypothetical protein
MPGKSGTCHTAPFRELLTFVCTIRHPYRDVAWVSGRVFSESLMSAVGFFQIAT